MRLFRRTTVPPDPIASIRRLEANPGDVLVIQLEHAISYEQALRLKEVFEATLPQLRALVLEAGTDITVLGPDALRDLRRQMTDRMHPDGDGIIVDCR